MEQLLEPSQLVIVQNGNMKGEVNDCGNAKRYDVIFKETTVKRFLVLMAIFYDLDRQTRVRGDSFCSVAMSLLSGARDGLAVNEKCGGITTVRCNGCANGPYQIRESDVTEFSAM